MIVDMAVTNAELLQQHPLLARLSLEQVLRFAQAGELELFHAGEDIVVEGTLGDALYSDPVGRGDGAHRRARSAAAGDAQAGRVLRRDVAGRAGGALGDGARRRRCEVFRVPHFAFANFLGDDSGALGMLLVAMVRTLSERLRRTNQMVGSMEQLTVLLGGSLV